MASISSIASQSVFQPAAQKAAAAAPVDRDHDGDVDKPGAADKDPGGSKGLLVNIKA